MKRSILSERNLAVVLFVMVVIVFSFAQADTPRIEKMYFNNFPQVTTSIDQAEKTKTGGNTIKIKPVLTAVQLR